MLEEPTTSIAELDVSFGHGKGLARAWGVNVFTAAHRKEEGAED